MRTAEQAFKAYYASMTDSDLLAVARNRISFIPLAQAQLAEELQRRQLAVPSEARLKSVTLRPCLRNCFEDSAMNPTKRSEPAEQERLASRPLVGPEPDTVTRRSHAGVGRIGATEDQVSMVGTLPERIDKHGTKIEDIAGTGQHDSLGG